MRREAKTTCLTIGLAVLFWFLWSQDSHGQDKNWYLSKSVGGFPAKDGVRYKVTKLPCIREISDSKSDKYSVFVGATLKNKGLRFWISDKGGEFGFDWKLGVCPTNKGEAAWVFGLEEEYLDPKFRNGGGSQLDYIQFEQRGFMANELSKGQDLDCLLMCTTGSFAGGEFQGEKLITYKFTIRAKGFNSPGDDTTEPVIHWDWKTLNGKSLIYSFHGINSRKVFVFEDQDGFSIGYKANQLDSDSRRRAKGLVKGFSSSLDPPSMTTR